MLWSLLSKNNMHWRFWLVYRKCRLTHCEFIIYLGSHRDVSFCFCACHSEAETLTRLGFFPSTPIHPSTAFQFLLLDKLESLLLECQVPLKDFLAALRCYSILPFMLVINIWYVYWNIHKLIFIFSLRKTTGICTRDLLICLKSTGT